MCEAMELQEQEATGRRQRDAEPAPPRPTVEQIQLLRPHHRAGYRWDRTSAAQASEHWHSLVHVKVATKRPGAVLQQTEA